MNYKLIETSGQGAEYREYRVEFDDADATAAWSWLALNNPQFTSYLTNGNGKMRVKINRNSPFFQRVQQTLRAIRPQHADPTTGAWIYVDGQYRPYPHGETLMGLYAEVVALLGTAVPTPYLCAGHTDACPNKVAARGTFCHGCAHDEE